MKRWSMLGIVFAGCLALCAPSVQAQTGYAVDTNENLYSINLATAGATLIGNTGQFLEGLALSPGGQLYGTDAGGFLFSINSVTGAATLIGSTGLGNIEGLTFNGSTLLGTNFNNPTTVYSINTTTAVATSVVSAGTGDVRAMTLRDNNNVLVSTDAPTVSTLANVDLTTGAVTNSGPLSFGFSATLAFASDGNLYSLDGNGNEYRVDPTTGNGTLIGNTGGQFWLDLAAAPAPAAVPEPGAIALFAGMGMAGAGFLRRRKQDGKTVYAS